VHSHNLFVQIVELYEVWVFEHERAKNSLSQGVQTLDICYWDGAAVHTGAGIRRRFDFDAHNKKRAIGRIDKNRAHSFLRAFVYDFNLS
jgi:hypothetical protein